MDKVTRELGKKFDKQRAKERVEDLRKASNIESSGEDVILAASRAAKAAAAARAATSENSTSGELEIKLRRRRQSIGEEAMTPTRKTGERSDISREREKQKKREKRDKKNDEGIASAPKGSTDANDLGESSSDEAYTSVCVGYALATFALFVLLLFTAYFVMVVRTLSHR